MAGHEQALHNDFSRILLLSGTVKSICSASCRVDQESFEEPSIEAATALREHRFLDGNTEPLASERCSRFAVSEQYRRPGGTPMTYVGNINPTTKGLRNAVALTITGEAFSPMRLYYSVPSESAVTRIFAKLRCMAEDRQELAVGLAVSAGQRTDVWASRTRRFRKGAPDRIGVFQFQWQP